MTTNIAPTQKKAHRRSVDRHGQEVTLRNFDLNQDDDYGEAPTETTDSPHTILARALRSQRPRERRDARTDSDVDVDRVYMVKDNADGVDDIRDGGGRASSEIEENGTAHYILYSEDQDNGLLRLECREER